jgi:vesicular inhibitory amino acid transporter
MALGIQALGDAGGVNSINNFARSWQRAAGFFEITPVRPSFRLESEDGRDEDESTLEGPSTPTRDHRSLLRAQLRSAGEHDHAVADDEEHQPTEESHLLPAASEERIGQMRRRREDSIISIEPSLSSPFGGSYGTSYGSLSERVNESSLMHAGRLFAEHQLKSPADAPLDREPLLVKQIEEDGKVINVVVGQSTLPQTVFNSVNVLVGIGILSLPLAFKYSGWVIGMVFLAFSAVVTSYTAKLLAKCLDVDSSLITFADLAYVSFGNRARIAVSILFSLELLASCVALVVLFADSMDDLVPGWGILAWKIVCGIILVPLVFLPLRFLSFTSVLGVMCCIASEYTCLTHSVLLTNLLKSHWPFSSTDSSNRIRLAHSTNPQSNICFLPTGWQFRFRSAC